MAKQYLDKDGLTYFWSKAKAYFQPKLVSGTNIKTVNNTSLLGSGNIQISGGTGTNDYNSLSNRPQINSVTLVGNKSSEQIGVVDSINPEIDLECWAGTTLQTSGTVSITTTSGDFQLVTGNYVVVNHANGSAAGISLKVDSSAAKACYYNGSTAPTIPSADITVRIYQYDGTYYQRLDPADTMPKDVLIAYYALCNGYESIFA